MISQSSTNNDAFEKLRSLVARELQAVDKLILDYAKSHAELIPHISEYLTGSGGKRLRPILTLICSKIYGNVTQNAIKLAAAVEFIHTATLLHDDVVDGSAKRRGKPTANNVWDNKVCILVGDYLFSQSFKLMVETDSLKTLNLLSTAAANIAESEVWQLELIDNLNLSKSDYLKLVQGKTAELFAAACAAGGSVSGCSEDDCKKLFNFGLNVGISFQIIDDVLDYTANADFGKKLGNDFLEGKVTLPIIESLEKADPADKKLLGELFNSKEKTESTFNDFKQILEKTSGIANARNCAKIHTNNALSELTTIQNKQITSALEEFANFLLQRLV